MRIRSVSILTLLSSALLSIGMVMEMEWMEMDTPDLSSVDRYLAAPYVINWDCRLLVR